MRCEKNIFYPAGLRYLDKLKIFIKKNVGNHTTNFGKDLD